MPVKSAKQFRLMEAAKHGDLKGPGPSVKVADDFLAATSHKDKSSFAKQDKFMNSFRKKKK